MSRRVISGLKGGLFVLISVVLIAFLLNYLGWDFGKNRIWNGLGNLNLIQFFNNNELNGLLVLGMILGVVAFILGFTMSDKKSHGAKEK
ncbi:hypothetical protein NGB28_06490 [Staphylococcus xylosus]|uniref:hypothetical protein n=1 Tax=Staphylococcus xylosus TaxID=1288 RepID=UPI001642619C|nr:hypothetical protein [Staphylococcus xylosus]MCD8851324.1 hypothetical protein [Staphylococcus xylosus]MCI8279050.1 hypothetical protein [Staphylococcus xylosus]MEB7659888.1 hypothetical protein [Staphylococcus xylosus]MEB7709776.1 hypothetical protein [Staphylococcus xylosus]MEB7785527.1 hypothetical protein [Staphylococcus xylosus]